MKMHSLKNTIIVVSMGVGVFLLFDVVLRQHLISLVNGVIQRVAFATNCNEEQEKWQHSPMNKTFKTTDSGQDSISHHDCQQTLSAF